MRTNAHLLPFHGFLSQNTFKVALPAVPKHWQLEQLANPKKIGATVWLRNAYASLQIGRARRRAAQNAFVEAIALAQKYSGDPEHEGAPSDAAAGVATGSSRASSAGGARVTIAGAAGAADGDSDDPMGGMGLSIEQLWVARCATKR